MPASSITSQAVSSFTGTAKPVLRGLRNLMFGLVVVAVFMAAVGAFGTTTLMGSAEFNGAVPNEDERASLMPVVFGGYAALGLVGLLAGGFVLGLLIVGKMVFGKMRPQPGNTRNLFTPYLRK